MRLYNVPIRRMLLIGAPLMKLYSSETFHVLCFFFCWKVCLVNEN